MARKKKVKEPVRKWGIDAESIKDDAASKKFHDLERRARLMMKQRTSGFTYFSRVSHMQNLYDHSEAVFSEGSTQAIKRKIRAETIQRVPDGEVKTQFDKNSLEQIQTEFIFNNKVLTSEYQGKDMLKNLWRAFDASYDYGFACVRTGFERDSDGDVRVSWKHIQWNDILPAPDCDFIEEADWYIVREHISRSDLDKLLDDDGNLKDSTYNEDVVRYLVENKPMAEEEFDSVPLADRKKSVTKVESVAAWTLYKRGEKEFQTFVPCVGAILRTTKNYDPRLEVPLHFLILEPDPDWPLGCSSIMWTLAQQQYADAFQTTAYQTLLLSLNPPLMVFGNLSNPKVRMKPHAMWQMGTNPNNKIEKFPVETTTVTQYNSILQGVQASMMKNLNVTESTVASDASVMTYSGTPQGVEQQKRDKTTTVNQYQKRLEVFFAEWANHALRSYINAMGGIHSLTVDEKTRRRVYDVEQAQADKDMSGQPMVDSIIEEDKIEIDFDRLSSSLLEFRVRTGSLIQSERDQEIQNIQSLLVPISQSMGNISDENRAAFENTLMRIINRLCELADIDISAAASETISRQVMLDSIQLTMETVMQQQQQIEQLQQIAMGQAGQQQQMEGQMQGVPQQGIPPQQPMPEQPQQSQQQSQQGELPPNIAEAIQNAAATQQAVPPQGEGVPTESPLPPEEPV